MKNAIRKFKETVEINSSLINKLKSHRYFSVSLLVGLFLAVACFHVWQRVQVVRLVKEISQLTKENDNLIDNEKKLYSELASLSGSSRIERYAMDTLGLQLVDADKLLTLVRKEKTPSQPDELQEMMTVVKRVADFLPVVEATRAKAGVVENITVDSTINGMGEK